jgi:cyclopropane fatty-acyl-phospholipid synthase-like methyltransferase
LFKPGQKILDFGCGGSYMLKNIKEKNTKLFGIEVNKETKILQKLMKLRFFK